MNITKISILIRSADVVDLYNKSTSGDFWNDLSKRLTESSVTVPPLHSTLGKSQHYFYVASEKDAGYFKSVISNIVSSMISDAEARKGVIVSVSVPGADDLNKLKQKHGDENEEFWKEADKITSAEPEPSKKGDLSAEPAEEDDEIVSSVAKAMTDLFESSKASKDNEGDPEPQNKELGPVSLIAQAERIKTMKAALLDRVKGQRHAVEEVVQGIFEAEMFSAYNTKRKGPLATFLFTGPSGVGKTFLANCCGEFLGRKMTVIDMSEFSDNLSNGKFNGEHGQPAMVTDFVTKYPDGILLFDEIEKAHINTIHLFLQILDEARLTDARTKKEVSFKNNIIIMTTNAGKALYDDPTVTDLSGVPRSVILEELRKDVDPIHKEPFFPECITTRMANGHVILFNHLEPFSLLEIVKKELAEQFAYFEKSSGIKVEYDPTELGALMMYNGGGTSDARSLRGLAKNIVVRETQEMLMQLYSKSPDKVKNMKNITMSVDTASDSSIDNLFACRDKMLAVCFADSSISLFDNVDTYNASFERICECDDFKKRVRGVTDFVLIDPLCGLVNKDRTPSDVEDVDSDGIRMFEYIREFHPETPVYILATSDDRSFETLLAKGAQGVIKATDKATFEKTIEDLSFRALINNAVYSLGRSGKFLDFNCAQYEVDDNCAIISFERLKLKSAARAGGNSMIAQKGANNNVMFKDVIGCKKAKEDLKEYCEFLNNPRAIALSGKRMPKGALLYGPPGTGKTLLAKAMANECKATFFQTSATGFFDMYVGNTEKNIRDLFAKARKYAPSIIFIDEVDAIGRMRTGSTFSRSNEDALTTFLTQMDGFVTDEKRPVFILAATNYDIAGESGRVLDPAFVRRFDSKILIPLPDTDDRYEFIKRYFEKRGISFGDDHDKIIRNMAERTGGMSNADLEMLHAGYIRMLGDKTPTGADYLDSLDSYRYGEVNKMDPKELRQTAYHEAGHALVCRLCGETPSYLTVVSRGNFGGYMASSGKKGSYTFDDMMDLACRALAGRAAEIEVYGESAGMNTGASSDIHHARYYVKACLMDYAMGKSLIKRWNPDEGEALMRKQFDRARELLRTNRTTLDRLTDLLVDKKSLDQGTLDEFFKSENV